MEASSSGTSSNTTFFTRRELLSIMRSSGSNELEKQFHFLLQKIKKCLKCAERDYEGVKTKIALFKSQYKYRWNKAHRMEKWFNKNNREWLDTAISFPKKLEGQRGRPKILFDASSERTKRLKTMKLRDSTPVSVLTYATQMSLTSEGHVMASKVLHEVTSTTPERAKKYREAYQKSLELQPQCMSGEDALAVLIGAKLSRHQYQIIRTSAPEKFPSYKIVQAAKNPCYPHNVAATETRASVPLQDLMDHTVHRLLLIVEPVIQMLKDVELHELCLYTKWGFDGSSGHSSYKQAFHGHEVSDSAVFITCIVPIRLVCGEKIIWQNPSPASTVHCRPLKIQFIKESTAVSIAEKNSVDEEIKNMQKTNTIFQGRGVEVCHKLIFTMVDGKVCNALTETTSTQRCFICSATSTQFNKVEQMIHRNINTENLQFGLSVLHGWIRMFECLLHLAYKLPIKKWQARGNDKEIVGANKARIQKEFRERCGLIVDTPKPGFGNTNDGNTARRFFRNAELSAEITKVDLELIKKLHTVMIVVASGYEIDVEKFRAFAHDTARYFVEKYPWYNMPSTVHKYLIHGPEIISSALLPIGQLSEEAQEARNKEFKRYREYNSRKCSREKTNQDIFNFFLISSDPVISSKRKIKKKENEHIPKEALVMLKAPTLQNDDLHVDEEGEDYSSDDSEA